MRRDKLDECEVCCDPTLPTDPHHPKGQRTERTMMEFIFVCRRCHDWIHANEKEARDKGYLHEEFFIHNQENKDDESTS